MPSGASSCGSRDQKGSAMARAGIITPQPTPPPLATTREVATFRRMTPGALGTERSKGKGPPYKKLNGRIFYDWSEVLSWIESNTLQRTDGQRPDAPPLRD